MANVIKLKRGSGSDPSASDMVLGEPVLRTDTAELFFKKDNGTVAKVSGGGGGGSDIFINTLSSSSGSGGGSATFNGTATRFTLSNPPSVSAQQLLVSINGVIQKPNSGTSPSEGFAIDGNDIIFASAPNTGSDFFIVTYGSLNIAVPADNSVTSAKIVDGTIVNADINASAAIAGSKISPDFGSQNIVTTGGLTVDTSTLHVDSSNNRVGIGTLNPTNQLHIYDNTAANDTPELKIESFRPSIRFKDRSSNSASAEIVGDNSLIFRVSTPVDDNTALTQRMIINSSGNVQIPNDSGKLQIGASQDLEIFHSGLHSEIADSGTGDLRILTSKFKVINNPSSADENMIVATEGGAVELYNGGSKKFETTITGVQVSGRIDITGTGTRIDIADNGKIILGDSNDMQIFHDGSTSYIKDTGTGNLRLCTSKGEFRNAADTQTLAAFIDNGAVELYFQGSKKFFTYGDGVHIDTGTLRGDDNAKIALGSGTNGDLRIYHDGNHSYIDNNTGSLRLRDAGGVEKLKIHGTGITVSGIINSTGDVNIGTNDNEPAQLEIRYSTVPTYLTSTFDGTFGEATLSVNVPRTSDGSGSWGSHSNTGYGSSAIQALSHPSLGGSVAILTGNADNTNPTQKMIVDGSGNTFFNITNGQTNPSGNNVTGTCIRPSGGISSNTNGDQHKFGRAQDGTIMSFSSAGGAEGSISISGTTTSFNGGTLTRWSQIKGLSKTDKFERPTIFQGTVMSNLDDLCEWEGEENQQLNMTKISDISGDKDVAGVFWAWDDDDDKFVNDFYVAMTGDMIIRVASSTTVARGDLLISAGDGTAKPQDDDIIRSSTIAKIISTNHTATYDDGSKAYPCVLMAC